MVSAAPATEDTLSDVDRFLGGAPGTPPPATAPKTLSPNDTLTDVDRFLAPSSPEPSQTQPPANETAPGTSDWIPPVVRNFGAGLLQGARDLGQTITGWQRQIDEAVPVLGAIDRFHNLDPGRDEKWLAGQTKDFEQTHGDSTAASIGRVVGNIAVTTPLLPVGAAGRGAQAVGNALLPRAANLIRGVTEGAVAGGGTNALTSGPSSEDPLTAAKEGAVMGGALGGAMPVVRAGIAGLSGTSGRALRAIADRLGIDLTTGQEVGGIIGRVEDATKIIPGSGAARAASGQNSQIAHAIAREAGIPGPVRQLTTPTLNAAETRIGDAIDNAAGRIDVPGAGPVGNTLLNRLGQIETGAQVAGATTPEANTARTLIDRILTTMTNRGGNMPGADFQRFIARGGELDSALNHSNRDIANVARQIREALYDAAQASGSTGVADLRNARYQYKVVQTVRDAIDKTADGSESMSQARLAQLIRNNFDMSRTGPGNNMQDLARLLQGVRPLASSGTAERLATYGALGIGTGGGAYYYMQHPDETENAILQYGPVAAGAILAGRASRLGPGLGLPGPRVVNPLLPRVMGPLYRPPTSDDTKQP